MPDRPLIPQHGGFRNLHAYKFSEIIHDATVVFCERFVDRKSRTTDQMIQTARSGKQNIAEGSMASGTSKKTELKLTGVARASLVELQLDFEDYLRQHDLPIWEKEGSQLPEDPKPGVRTLGIQAVQQVQELPKRPFLHPLQQVLRKDQPRNSGKRGDLPPQPGNVPPEPVAGETGRGLRGRRGIHPTPLHKANPSPTRKELNPPVKPV
jgi:four helix bundle protein